MGISSVWSMKGASSYPHEVTRGSKQNLAFVKILFLVCGAANDSTLAEGGAETIRGIFG